MDDATATTDEVKKDNIKKSYRTLLMRSGKRAIVRSCTIATGFIF